MDPFAGRMRSHNCSVERFVTTVSLADYVPQCVDVPKFLAYCRDCPSYGTRWSCPPHDFDPMDIWGRYEALSLVVLVITPDPGATREEAMAALVREKNDLLENLLTLETKMSGSLALSAGSCQLCRFCARKHGVPCYQPHRMRPSIEALGGDVGKTLERYLGKTIRWTRPDEVPEYLTLVGGLLIPANWKGGDHG